jgi:hypothetical protein
MPVAVAAVPPLPAVPLKNFNKGITQGMLEPLHELVQPYSAFPKQITGKTVWKREDFINDESLWKRQWSPEHVASLEAAYDAWAAKNLSLPEIDRVSTLCSAHLVAWTAADGDRRPSPSPRMSALSSPRSARPRSTVPASS